MCYEVRGESRSAGQVSLVLIHGGISAIGTSFGKILPASEIFNLAWYREGWTGKWSKPATWNGLNSPGKAKMKMTRLSAVAG
jgi:hypothetical protein